MTPMPPHDLSWLTARPVAHRGLHDLNKACWENTPTAFRRAVARNFAIECDVNLTADGVAVVFHDQFLKRLTGHNGKVSDTRADDLCQMAIGGTEDRPLRLGELLDLVDGKVPVVIELKGNVGHDDGFVAVVADNLKGYGGKAAIMSFDHHLIRQFSAQAPGIPAGLTAEGSDRAALEAHFSMLANGLSFVSYDVGALPNPFVSFIRDRLALPFITWTVRDRQAAELTWHEGGQITFEGFDPDELS